MLRTSESETEILLGNKQLLGIFFVVACLLGIAFYGGYMVGRGPVEKKTVGGPAATGIAGNTAQAASRNAPGGETHSFPTDTSAPVDQTPTVSTANVRPMDRGSSTAPQSEEPVLGERPKATPVRQPGTAADSASEEVEPQPGDQFLQVAAVGKDEAEGVADVLHKKGFRARAVPKPGNAKIYRVLIGPIRDAGDLSSTRDALRRTGFREIIVQRY